MAKVIEPVCVVDWDAIDCDIDNGYNTLADAFDVCPHREGFYIERQTFNSDYCNAEHSKLSIKYKERYDWRLKVERECREYRPYWFECSVRRMQEAQTLAYYRDNGLMHLYYTNPETANS